jgi:hypothetical protein
MLVIRKEQMNVFEEYAQKGFERELVEHVKDFAPKHAAAIGDAGVREAVRLGLERANAHGFSNRGPVRFYVEMMCMFGSDFDTDAQIPWAGGTLKNEMMTDQMERADALFDKMTEYEEEVSGPEKKYYLDALERLAKTSFENYNLAGSFDGEVAAALQAIYPHKAENLGKDGIAKLIERGKAVATEHSVKSVRGAALFIALMFTIGHGFASDPFYPWISKTLAEDALAPDEKAERIYAKMKLYLEETLKS